MIKILGLGMAVGGAIALILGVLGVFGSIAMGAATWPCIILGVIFFFAGISMLKRQKDTDEIEAES